MAFQGSSGNNEYARRKESAARACENLSDASIIRPIHPDDVKPTDAHALFATGAGQWKSSLFPVSDDNISFTTSEIPNSELEELMSRHAVAGSKSRARRELGEILRVEPCPNCIKIYLTRCRLSILEGWRLGKKDGLIMRWLRRAA